MSLTNLRIAFLYCLADHPTRPALVAKLSRHEEGRWLPTATDGVEERATEMAGDVALGQVQVTFPASPEIPGRRRHVEAGPCKLCGVKLSVRGERLDAALDREWAWAESEQRLQASGTAGLPVLVLSLKALAASL